MEETKVRIGEEVLLDIGTHSEWYISSIGYDGESVAVALRRKADRNKEWWLADTPQTDTHDIRTDTHECVKDTHDKDEPQTETDWKDEMWLEVKERVEKFLAKDETLTDCAWKEPR